MRNLGPAFAPLALAAVAAAQTTWTVPAGASLDPFVAQAAPGDVLVLGAQHPSFQLTKGLTLRPAAGRTTILPPSPSEPCSILAIPPGQQAVLARLDFAPAAFPPGPQGNGIVLLGGSAGCEDCTFATLGGIAIVQNAGTLALQRCVVEGASGGMGMLLVDGSCSAADCTFAGADADPLALPPAPPQVAIGVLSGTLVISHSSLAAGASGTHPLTSAALGPVPGLHVQSGQVFVTDSTVAGGEFPTGTSTPPPWFGAPAIRCIAGGVELARTTLLVVNAIAPTEGQVAAAPAQVGLRCSGPWQRGSLVTLAARAGSSGQPLAFAYWIDLVGSAQPLVVEPLWGPPGLANLAAISAPAPGAAVLLPMLLPNTAALRDVRFWMQALQLDAPALRGSAVVGGLIH